MVGLEVPRRGQAVNQGWLLQVLILGNIMKVMGLTESRCCLIEIM